MDTPGNELPKEYREIAEHLVKNQGWRYDKGAKRGGYPMLYPADRSQNPLAVPTTPVTVGPSRTGGRRSRRRGGQLPKKGG